MKNKMPAETKNEKQGLDFKDKFDKMIKIAVNIADIYDYHTIICNDNNLSDEEKNQKIEEIKARLIELDIQAKEIENK